MTNILFISADEVFKNDLMSQISYHAEDFEFIKPDEDVTPDILLIDEDIKAMQTMPKIPTIFIISQSENIDDAYKLNHVIKKPFELYTFLDELRACVNIFNNSEQGFITFNQYQLRPSRKDILNLRNNDETKLTEKEIAIIKYLYKFQDRIVSKNELLQDVWGYSSDVSTHTIETHIYRLRQKVEQDNPNAQLILTEDGGYQLKV